MVDDEEDAWQGRRGGALSSLNSVGAAVPPRCWVVCRRRGPNEPRDARRPFRPPRLFRPLRAPCSTCNWSRLMLAAALTRSAGCLDARARREGERGVFGVGGGGTTSPTTELHRLFPPPHAGTSPPHITPSPILLRETIGTHKCDTFRRLHSSTPQSLAKLILLPRRPPHPISSLRAPCPNAAPADCAARPRSPTL